MGTLVQTKDLYNQREHLKSWDAKGVKYPENE